MNVLLWLKRDLRLFDHPALMLAAGLGDVLPLYVVEPDYWALPDTSARQWDATADALADLRDEIATMGGVLVLRIGDAIDHIARLCRHHSIERIVSHEETGNLWTYARDRRVAAWARGSHGKKCRNVAWCAGCGDAMAGPDSAMGSCARPWPFLPRSVSFKRSSPV
jgi:deoxyribodipyrimidine photo-lyase